MIDRITSLKVDLALNMTGRGMIRFDDAGYVVSSDTGNFGAGSEIEIGAGTATSVQRRDHRRRARASPRPGRLRRHLRRQDRTRWASATRSGPSSSRPPPTIVSTIAREYGLQAAVDATTEQIGYLIEAGSDLELLSTLAEHEGYDWWVSDGTLNFKAPAGGAVVAGSRWTTT